MNTESVVIPVGAATSSVTCVRELSKKGLNTIAVSEYDNAPVFESRYCDEKLLISSPSNDLKAYKDSLLSIVKRSDVTSVIPAREEDVYVLSKFRSEFAPHVGVAWPDMKTLQFAHDRKQLFEAAQEAGVPEPETELIKEVDDWNRELIIKSRYAILADEYADNEQMNSAVGTGKTIFHKPGHKPNIENIKSTMKHSPIVQKFIPGQEYTFRALYNDGEPIVTTQKQLIRGFKYSQGPSVFHKSVHHPKLEEVGRKLLDHLDWHGLASVGFIRDERSGKFKLLEINPRLWSSVPIDLYSGISYPEYYWKMSTGDVEDIESNYQTGKASHWLRGEVAHLHSVIYEDYPNAERPHISDALQEMAISMIKHPRYELLSLDDPKPFFKDIKNQIKDVIKM